MTVDRLRIALREHRLREHLSYDEVAAAIGLDRINGRTLRRFENAEGNPLTQTIYDIEQYLRKQRQAVA